MCIRDRDSATVENSFRPYQAYLALNQYPLTRSVYILLNDPKIGLPSGLTSFLIDITGHKQYLCTFVYKGGIGTSILSAN